MLPAIMNSKLFRNFSCANQAANPTPLLATHQHPLANQSVLIGGRLKVAFPLADALLIVLSSRRAPGHSTRGAVAEVVPSEDTRAGPPPPSPKRRLLPPVIAATALEASGSRLTVPTAPDQR